MSNEGDAVACLLWLMRPGFLFCCGGSAFDICLIIRSCKGYCHCQGCRHCHAAIILSLLSASSGGGLLRLVLARYSL